MRIRYQKETLGGEADRLAHERHVILIAGLEKRTSNLDQTSEIEKNGPELKISQVKYEER